MSIEQQHARRLAYIDWMRGFACLLMFQTHCYNSWLSPQDRKSALYAYSQLGGTLPAPLFIFLAGVSFALVTEKLRQKGTDSRRNRANHNSSRRRNLRPRTALPHPGIHSRISHRAVDRSLPRRRSKHPRHLDDADGRSVLVDRVSRKHRHSRNRSSAYGFGRICQRRLDGKKIVAGEVTRLRDRRRNSRGRNRRSRHAAGLEDDAFLGNAVAARNLSQRRPHLRTSASVALSRFFPGPPSRSLDSRSVFFCFPISQRNIRPKHSLA